MDLISFVLLSNGKSPLKGQKETEKCLMKLGNRYIIQYVLDSIKKFLNILNLEKKIPVKVVLHDYIQQEDFIRYIPELNEDQIIIDEVVWNDIFSDIPKPPQKANDIFGIWSAMTELKEDYRNIFTLACDSPFISETILSYIFNDFFKNIKNNKEKYRKITEQRRYLSYIPMWENKKFEYFSSIYHIKSLLPVIEKNILKKQYSLQTLFSKILENKDTKNSDSRYKIQLNKISIEKELMKYDKELMHFRNINSKKKFMFAEKRILSSNKKLNESLF
ncbi:MAG: hypothetical protein ACTSWY_13555 [Promethearchaeota archaeon]